jgi:FG-GAP-like repeat
VVGSGDFNGDGDSDILWQNRSSGQVSIWEMDGNTRIGGGAVANSPGPAWKAIGTGDFYGHGLSDILFRNASTGQVSIWEVDGNTRIGGVVTPIPGPSERHLMPQTLVPTPQAPAQRRSLILCRAQSRSSWRLHSISRDCLDRQELSAIATILQAPAMEDTFRANWSQGPPHIWDS